MLSSSFCRVLFFSFSLKFSVFKLVFLNSKASFDSCNIFIVSLLSDSSVEISFNDTDKS